MVKRGGASKFPVARIKKIMQADEDIGKVANATPVVISKALELFLEDLVSSTVDESRSKGARKLTAYHLKRAVHNRETLDFLKDIVEKVPDPVQSESTAGGATPSTRKRQQVGEVFKGEHDVDGGGGLTVTKSATALHQHGQDSEDYSEEENDDDDDEEYGRKGKKIKRQ